MLKSIGRNYWILYPNGTGILRGRCIASHVEELLFHGNPKKQYREMNRKSLLEKAKALGYPLFEIEETIKANEILADIVNSEDLRLWEGFPVMLANSLDKNLFDFDKVLDHLSRNQEREHFLNLVMISMALYDFLELEFSFADQLYQSNYFDKNRYEEFLRSFKQKKYFVEFGRELSSDRLVNTFKNYFSLHSAD